MSERAQALLGGHAQRSFEQQFAAIALLFGFGRFRAYLFGRCGCHGFSIAYPTDGVYDLTFAEVSATSVEGITSSVKFGSKRNVPHVI
jgi:hypothetical protein